VIYFVILITLMVVVICGWSVWWRSSGLV